MASSSSSYVPSSSAVFTLRDYFEKHQVDETQRESIINRINEYKKEKKLFQRTRYNFCTDASKEEGYGYTRKIAVKLIKSRIPTDSAAYPVISFKGRRLVILKREEFTLYGGFKKVTPAVALDSAEDPLDMRLFAWAKQTVKGKKIPLWRRFTQFVRGPCKYRANQREILARIERALDREIDYLKEFAGEKTVELHGSMKYLGKKDLMSVGMIMEWCPESLSQRLKYGSLSDQQKLDYAKELMEMLCMLKEKKIYFRDLKEKNLLIDAANRLKLADFGLAVHMDRARESLAGTDEYCAPEYCLAYTLIRAKRMELKNIKSRIERESIENDILFLREKGVTLQGDVWAAGIVLFKMIHNEHPFLKFFVNSISIYFDALKYDHDAIQEGIDKVFNPDLLKDPINEILRGMLTINPERRLTCEEVLERLKEINLGEPRVHVPEDVDED